MVLKVALLALALISIAATESPETRIVGGTPTTIYNYPFVASIIYTYPEDNVEVQRCVGSLISSWHVLTTAFCFTDAIIDNAKVRAGSTNSLSGGTVVSISEVIIHPDYVEQPRTADIAIVVLSDYLAISNSIRVVYIPPQETYIPDGHPVKTLSWGFESEEGPQIESLKVFDTNTISMEQCIAAYADNDNIRIYDQAICTQAEDRSMCRGDSGAPLILGEVLVGVSSYYGSCDSSTPDVFARVDRHTGWILEQAVPPAATLRDDIVPVRVARSV